MKRLLLGAILALGTLCVQSQELPKIVPPSPEAAALGTFTEVPVSHYTGLPNISVPIYTIQEGGVSIPISLSYHARGVQISQVAPRTGMSWALTYGGSISRQVRGKGDESPNHGYLINKNDFLTYSTNLLTRQAVDTKEQTNNGYDFYPDQFNFNVGGVTGKFVLDYDTGLPVVQSFRDITITYTRENGSTGKIDAFVMIDAVGNTYYYGISKDGLRTGQDYQDSQGMSIDINNNVNLDPVEASSERIYSAWKLMDIEIPNGDLISYYYELDDSGAAYYRKAYDKHNPPGGSISYTASGYVLTTGTGTVPNTLANMTNLQEIRTRISKVWNYEKQLSKITFNKGRDSVVFTKAQTQREDFIGHALDKISIYSAGGLIKTFNLNYTYYSSVDQTTSMPGHFIGNSVFEKYFKRMFLTSIVEEGSDGQTLPPHTFTYEDPTQLPSMFSSRQDYWGYYNGATNNGPFTRIFDYGNYIPDRRVDTLKSEAGILKEIKYPTGGKTKLTYEHNKGLAPAEFNLLKLPSINPGSQDEVEITLTKADFPIDPNTGGYTPYNIQLPYTTQITYRVGCFHLSNVNNPLPPGINCLFDFTVNGGQINIEEDVIIYTGNQQTYNGSTTIGVLPISHPSIPNNLHLDSNYDFTLTIKYDLPDVRANLYGAGKRIKRIENITQTGDALTKEYEYLFAEHIFAGDSTFGGTPLHPSGSIIGLPAFINTSPPDANGYANMTKYYDATSAYSNYQPNSIGYSSVIEYYGTRQDNIGKTEYTFTNMMDSGGDYWEFPYHPPTDNEWLRGKPIRTRIFKKKENGDYGLIKEIHNKYLYADVEYTADYELPGFYDLNFALTPQGEEYNWTLNALTLGRELNRTKFKLPLFMRLRLDEGVDITNTSLWGYRIYHLTGGTQHLLRTTEKDYNDAGTIEKLTTYGYDYSKHYQLKSTSVTDSKGDVMETINYYPADVLGTTDLGYDALTGLELSAILKLRAPDAGNLTGTHQVATPVQVETKKNTNVLSVVRSNFYITSGLVLPKSTETSKGGAALEERMVYHSYLANGNVQEVSNTNGTRIVYIWGYNQMLPVAKIENATFSSISTTLYNNVVNASNADNDRTEGTAGNEGALRTALSNLRNALPNAQMTSFTYDPLIGVTSMTDPRGRTVYYHYDSFNRLQFVKDHDGNVVSKTEYNYKN